AHGNLQAEFAGAGRPLLWVPQAGGPCQELPGNRVGLGGYSIHEKHFEVQHWGVPPGQALYLFSDGITDQFGGEHKRKFSKKRLADLLAEVAHLPCQVPQQLPRHYFAHLYAALQ
ncbi:MAG: hypothetical protein EAY75_00375, partial [Bacteroidetes bacterium]